MQLTGRRWLFSGMRLVAVHWPEVGGESGVALDLPTEKVSIFGQEVVGVVDGDGVKLKRERSNGGGGVIVIMRPQIIVEFVGDEVKGKGASMAMG
ncbi:hypothetical protein L1887_34538 [Cichorium endivia]|nr:hypothetical protein L1887_34538 [Cichorium endivia]